MKGYIGCGILAKHVSNQTRTETNQDTSALHSLKSNLVTGIILTNKSPELINNPATIEVNWYSKATKANQFSPIINLFSEELTCENY